jgi:hypothetical protein
LKKYLKCNVWRLAVRYDIYIYIIYIYMTLGGKGALLRKESSIKREDGTGMRT